jgi:hypothetical protein
MGNVSQICTDCQAVIQETILLTKMLELSIKEAVTKPRGRDEDINKQAGELTWVMLPAELLYWARS